MVVKLHDPWHIPNEVLIRPYHLADGTLPRKAG